MISEDQYSFNFILLSESKPPVCEELYLYGIGQGKNNGNEIISNFQNKLRSFLILTVTKGILTVFLDGEEILIHDGQVLLSPVSSFMGSGHTQADYVFAVIGGRIAELYLNDSINKMGNLLDFDHLNPSIDGLCQTLGSFKKSEPFDGLWGSVQAYELLISIISQCGNHSTVPSIVNQAKSIIMESYANIYGIEDIAQILNISESHLIRVFSKNAGISPGQYLTKVRINNAKLLLMTGKYSLEAIANMTGFSGDNYFCKVFRRHTGMTPGEYSDLNKNADNEVNRKISALEKEIYI